MKRHDGRKSRRLRRKRIVGTEEERGGREKEALEKSGGGRMRRG